MASLSSHGAVRHWGEQEQIYLPQVGCPFLEVLGEGRALLY